ncbi:MAG TPA: response regulator transcription factor [Acetobacteraceae bacterium]|nr:response regulator transcription factor [Acetobacteraceae bacterium]
MRLLAIEDEQELAELLHRALGRAGFAVDLAPDLAGAEDHLGVAPYDAVILDLALPDGDGLALLRRLRARDAAVPVLILTARDGPEDRVAGLDAGADDYLVKPFHMPELVSRLRALLRRPNAALGLRLELGNLAFDTVTRDVLAAGSPLRLSPRETALLEMLLRRPGRVIPREAIEQSLYSFDEPLGSNAIEVLVHRLRRKLLDSGVDVQVHTLRGVGYLLADPA